ncbi:MAG: hypothetical protein AAGG99_07755 [Pseudomonadota bacterium]
MMRFHAGAGPARATDLLVTGFGPFPTVDHNASGELAHAIAYACADTGRAIGGTRGAPPPTVKAATLATSWQTAPRGLERLIMRTQPAAVLAFGVSKRATGFVIETTARNIAAAEDIHGTEPLTDTVEAGGRRTLSARLPARRLVATLRANDVAARRSIYAGAYLCNALLYKLLSASAPPNRGPAVVAFVHLPAALLEPKIGGLPCRLDWADAIRGGVLLANEVIQIAHARRDCGVDSDKAHRSDRDAAHATLQA